MRPFIKAQASSLAASAADVTTSVILKDVFHIWYLKAAILGTITGGIVNFLINRNWVFQAMPPKEVVLNGGNIKMLYSPAGRPTHIQAARYGLVWVGNLILNAAGVYLLTHYCSVNNILISKIFVSLIVGFSYNYLLQKRFVFSKA